MTDKLSTLTSVVAELALRDTSRGEDSELIKETPMSTMKLTTENPWITDVFVKLGTRVDAKNKE